MVYANASIGLMLASKYLPENMALSIYQVASMFETADCSSPLSYVYVFISLYLLTAPKPLLRDFTEVALSNNPRIINYVSEVAVGS